MEVRHESDIDNPNELYQRQETVRRVDALREQIFAKYGEMPDSTALIREDREI